MPLSQLGNLHYNSTENENNGNLVPSSPLFTLAGGALERGKVTIVARAEVIAIPRFRFRELSQKFSP